MPELLLYQFLVPISELQRYVLAGGVNFGSIIRIVFITGLFRCGVYGVVSYPSIPISECEQVTDYICEVDLVRRPIDHGG